MTFVNDFTFNQIFHHFFSSSPEDLSPESKTSSCLAFEDDVPLASDGDQIEHDDVSEIRLPAVGINGAVADQRCFLSPANLPRCDVDDEVQLFFPPKVKPNVPRIVHMHRGGRQRGVGGGHLSPGDKPQKKSPVKSDKNTLTNVS